MQIESIFYDNSVLVIPNNIKNKVLDILNKQDKLYNIKIISLDELKACFLYQYDNEAIYYLMEKYHFKYDVAITYLENIKYLENDSYNVKKINDLLSLKRELLENKKLFKDDFLRRIIKDRRVIIYGYDFLSSFDEKVLSNCNYEFFDKKIGSYKHTIYALDTIEDEIEFVASKIIDLINSGISIDKIKLANVNNEYLDIVRDVFKKFNLPINNLQCGSIYETNIIKYFLNNISSDTVLDDIINKYNMDNPNNNYVYFHLINILNKYTFIPSYTLVKEMLINDFKNTKNYNIQYDKAIEVINLKDNCIFDDEYVFFIGFNMEYIPEIFQDNDFIPDNIKNKFFLDDHYTKNEQERNRWINIFSSLKNVFITYKEKTSFRNYLPSSLNDLLNYDIEKIDSYVNKYSKKMNEIKLSYMLDDLVKYNKVNNNLPLYLNSYNHLPYLAYDNSFKGINKDDLYDYMNHNLLLSYSSVDNFMRCKFRYYINNILKLNPFEETFYTKIGNIFHEVLSKCFDDNFDFDKAYDEATSKIELDYKEKFFVRKLKDELKFVINTICEQNTYSSLKNNICENKFYVNKDKNIKVTFMGVVDKIITDDDNKYLVIVDYKTGIPHTNLYNTIYGIDMQLPIYLYLTKKSNKFNKAEVIGFYLQKIINKHKEEDKKNDLKLMGYSINDTDLLSKFDSSYQNSNVIKSMKISSTGFYSISKVISKNEIDKLIKLVDMKIDEAIADILSADFEINPKVIGDENLGCMNCKNKDICFMREHNLKYLDKYSDFSFLNEE